MFLSSSLGHFLPTLFLLLWAASSLPISTASSSYAELLSPTSAGGKKSVTHAQRTHKVGSAAAATSVVMMKQAPVCTVPQLKNWYKVKESDFVKGVANNDAYTNRSTHEFFQLLPSFVEKRYISHLTTSQVPVRVLEIGCGAGNTLLHLGRYVNMTKNSVGINKGGYAFVQSESEYDVVLKALTQQIPVTCLNGQVPIIPEIHLMDHGVGKEEINKGTFDLVISLYSLDEGKLEANETGFALRNIFNSMNDGSVALLFMPMTITYEMYKLGWTIPPDLSMSNKVVRTYHFSMHGSEFTMFLYFHQYFYYKTRGNIGLVVKRCDKGYHHTSFTSHDPEKEDSLGCFAEGNSRFPALKKEDIAYHSTVTTKFNEIVNYASNHFKFDPAFFQTNMGKKPPHHHIHKLRRDTFFSTMKWLNGLVHD